MSSFNSVSNQNTPAAFGNIFDTIQNVAGSYFDAKFGGSSATDGFLPTPPPQQVSYSPSGPWSDTNRVKKPLDYIKKPGWSWPLSVF